MANVATIPFVPPGPSDRQRTIMDVSLAWHSIRAASAYIQELDVLIAKASVWGDAYANAQSILEAAIGRLETWHGSPYPVEADQLEFIRQSVYDQLRAARRHVMAFEWHRAQAQLFGAGTALLGMAHHMGVLL